MIDTLIEVYDRDDAVLNVLGAWMLRPRRVVYCYTKLAQPEQAAQRLRQVYEHIGLHAAVEMAHLDVRDMDALPAWLHKNQGRLGHFALEVSGGDDLLLFALGRCYEQFQCPAYIRRGNGRYYAIHEGKRVDAQPPEFDIASRFLLSGGRLQRYARVGPDDLTPEFLHMAEQLLRIQQLHPYQMMKQTQCLQGAVAQAANDALTVILEDEKTKRYGFTAAKCPLLRKLERLGALSLKRIGSDQLSVTFASRSIRDGLCDHGIWLECYTYDVVKASGAFDDVGMSCVVEWADGKTVNELDVVATAGAGLASISCKTCAPDMVAINEVKVLSDRFGAGLAQPVLSVMPKGREKLTGTATRCKESGVELIDIRNLSREEAIAAFAAIGKRLRGQ